MRFAIYYMPITEHLLSQAGQHWLGRDMFTGDRLPMPAALKLGQAEWEELTAEPRRYGFHATLKAPFRLAESVSIDDLVAAFDRFCANNAAFHMPQLEISQLHAFFALTPVTHSQPLGDFAAECVRYFHPFAAPLNEAEVAKRNPALLSASQRHHLDQWGYPYVFDEFRFHMTLTRSVTAKEAPALRLVLEEHFDTALSAPMRCTALALAIEEAPAAPFLVHRFQSLLATR